MQVASESELVDIPLINPPKRKVTNPHGNPKWVKGGPSPNPHGRIPPKTVTWEDPGIRGKFLIQKYGIKEILKFAKNIKKAPLSTQDAQIVAQIARSFEDGQELERFQNRTFGKVPDKQINLNVNLDVSPEQLSERAMELLARISD
jgi:hypothetical protein